MNNKKIGLGIVGIIVLVGVFYGGIVYGKSQIAPRGQRGMGGQAFAAGGGGAGGFRNMGGFTTGQIIAKDEKSITVQLVGGGSKIIFLDANTKISKSTAGILADLAVGTQVSVTGAANTDGSVNAQMVQIRPNMTGAVVK
ncbi:MAG TPA: hypothetical protein VGO21_04340 [Candidatus Paceibacterota bacterium]|jgi:hypothetical protein|nr:hypothetical protein [Candidatus Paceibacterota bacterium]